MRILLLAVAAGAALLSAGCDRQAPGQSQARNVDEAAPGRPGLSRAAAGQMAPDVTFRDAGGDEASLADARGRPVLVNLWATWCAPCVQELPTLDALADRPGAPLVLALSQDMVDQQKVQAFLAERGIALDAWHDRDMGLSSALGVTILPTTILYGSDGREIWRYTGDLDWTGPRAAQWLREAR